MISPRRLARARRQRARRPVTAPRSPQTRRLRPASPSAASDPQAAPVRSLLDAHRGIALSTSRATPTVRCRTLALPTDRRTAGATLCPELRADRLPAQSRRADCWLRIGDCQQECRACDADVELHGSARLAEQL